MPDKILDDKQKVKLDDGIKKMISYGASKDDVVKYASDFKMKFGADVPAQKAPSISAMPELIESEKQGTQKDKPAPTFPSIDEVFAGVKDRRAVAESTIGANIRAKVEKAIDIQAIPQRKIEREEKIKQTKITALDNTVKKKLDASGVKYTVGDALWNKTKNDTQKLADSEDIALTVNAKGEPIYKPALHGWASLIQSFKKSYNDEKEAFEFSSANFDDKIKIADEVILKPVEEEGVPTGVRAAVGEFFGESAIMLGQGIGGAKAGSFAVSKFTKSPLPIAVGGMVGSFAAMAPSAYSKGKKNETIQRYAQAINELQSKKGFVTYEDKKTAMNTALAQGTRAGLLDVANVAVLSLPFGRVAAGKGLVKTIEHAMKSAAVDVVKFGTSSGVTQLAKDASASQMGYNVKAADMMNNFLSATGEGAKTALAFWAMHQATGTIPKYVHSAANEYLSSIYEPDLTNMSLSLENSGVVPEGTTAETMRKLKKYNAARRKVPPIVPEEHISSFAGIIEKKDNLEELKKNSDPSFHPKIDEQIAAEDVKLGKMLESENPLELEVDDRTGDSGIPEPQTAGDVEMGVEAIEGPEKEAIKLPVADMVGKRVTYKGKDATIFRDGMQYVLGIEGTNREVELGNVDEIGDTEISNFGIEYNGEIEVADDNSVTIRGKKYFNNYSDPKSAVDYDENGYVRSVSLDTPTGQKRTFRGVVADEIAYQIKLKEIEQNDETAAEFEQFIEQNEPAKQQIISGENEAVAKEGAAKANEAVPREKAEPTTEPLIEKPAEKEGDEVFIRLADGSSKTGAKVIVPGFEKMDFVVVKDGMNHRIVELSTGMELAESSGFSIEESVNNLINSLKGRTQEQILESISKNEMDKVSPRVKVINKSESYERYKQEKSKEYEGLPNLYNEEELAKLNKYKAEAQEKGLDNVVSMIDATISQKKVNEKTLKMQDIDNLRNSIDRAYASKVVKESQESGQPIPQEFIEKRREGTKQELESIIDSNYKKKQFSKLPKNIIDAAIDAYKKQSEIFNKYGYFPKSLKEGIDIAIGKYIVSENSRGENKTQRVNEDIDNIFKVAKDIDGLYSSEMEYDKSASEFNIGDIIIAPGGQKFKVVGKPTKTYVKLKNLSDPYRMGQIQEFNKNLKTFRLFEQKKAKKLFYDIKENARKRRGPTGIFKEVMNSDVPIDARAMAMHYLANGGKVSRQSFIDEVSGYKKMGKYSIKQNEEVNTSNFVGAGADSISKVAENIYSDNKLADVDSPITDIEIRNELIDLLLEYEKRTKIAEDYMEKYGEKEFEGSPEDWYLKNLEQEYIKEQQDLEKSISEYIESEGEKELELSVDEEYIKKLIEQYEQESIAEDKAASEGETAEADKTDIAFRNLQEERRLSGKYEIPREDRLDRDYRDGEQDTIRQQLEKLGGVDEAYKQFERDGYKDSGWGLEDYLLKKACE
jgi:hypothetical protein